MTEETGVVPVLAAILAGDDPASQKYVEMKARPAPQADIGSRTYPFSKDTPQAEVEDRLAALNADPSVHGILIQHPLPKHMDEPAVLSHARPGQRRGRHRADLAGAAGRRAWTRSIPVRPPA